VTWEEATGPPHVAGVLYIVSPSAVTGEFPTWISHISSLQFRPHLVGLDVSHETFADLAALCAGESWHLDAFVRRGGWAEFIVEFIASREIDVVQVIESRVGVDLAPALHAAYPPLSVVVDVGGEGAEGRAWLDYATSRYGNVIDAFCTPRPEVVEDLRRAGVSASRVHLWEPNEQGPDEAAGVIHRDVYGQLLSSAVT
jgi:hypothetical protein